MITIESLSVSLFLYLTRSNGQRFTYHLSTMRDGAVAACRLRLVSNTISGSVPFFSYFFFVRLLYLSGTQIYIYGVSDDDIQDSLSYA